MAPGTLYLCPTPLGNLEDVTLRVLRTLREADKIAAEDTRHTRKLLSHYNIHTPLVSYHEHNKKAKTALLINWLQEGQTIALVSDAGTPAISDPGEELVQAAIARNLPVVSLPGPTALITALTASGLPVCPFAFYGFLPSRGKEKKAMLEKILAEEKTVIFYEAPHRLQKTLAALKQADGNRRVVVARELTKMHEEYHRGTLAEIADYFAAVPPRGECTVLLEAAAPKDMPQMDIEALAAEFLAKGLSTREAAREVARLTGLSRNEVYQKIIKKK
ncbi:MAG: 16S rRNA (cytidine(1402)-2'-O)-methyltransferase [Firmicutes bacterium]|nr:16S rRNA (cytidine(1402)-2'-O)-methyltransferase [Bacillota bacterium]